MDKGVTEEGQTTQWTKGNRRTDNTMDKGVTEEGQTTQWSKG